MLSTLEDRDQINRGNEAERFNNNEGSSDAKNPEINVNNPSYFNDDFETEQEDNLSSDEARSENDKRSGS